MAMQVVRVGVIGTGGMGSFHARVLAAMARTEVVAVADPIASGRDRLADELDCSAHADPFELLARDDLDGVVIASPDHTHADLAVVAVERRLWTLCEKPLATDLDEAERVVAAERAAGDRRIQLGFMREYDPSHVALAAALPAIGSVDVVRAVHRNCSPQRRPIAQLVGQSMVHDFHSVRFLLGQEIVSVQTFVSGLEGDWARHLLAVCALSGGGHAMVEFDDAGFAYEVRFEVSGRAGDLATNVPAQLERRGHGSIEQVIGDDWFGRFAEAYRLQDAAWIASVRAGAAAGPSALDGWRAQAVVDATLESLRSGGPVAVAVC